MSRRAWLAIGGGFAVVVAARVGVRRGAAGGAARPADCTRAGRAAALRLEPEPRRADSGHRRPHRRPRRRRRAVPRRRPALGSQRSCWTSPAGRAHLRGGQRSGAGARSAMRAARCTRTPRPSSAFGDHTVGGGRAASRCRPSPGAGHGIEALAPRSGDADETFDRRPRRALLEAQHQAVAPGAGGRGARGR